MALSRPDTTPAPLPGNREEPSPSEPREGFIAIGRVLGAWGLQGAVKVESLTDFPERYAKGARLWLAGTQRRITHVHARRGGIIVKLSGINDPDAAQRLCGTVIELPEAELHALDEDEYYEHDLIGLSVRTEAGEELGRVDALLPTGANPVLVVHGDGREYLLPFIDEVVRNVDLGDHSLTVELLPGLESAPVPASTPERKSRPKAGAASETGAETPDTAP